MPTMRLSHSVVRWPLLLAFLTSLSRLTLAQGVLSNGNSQFPSCAASCESLNQAAAACGGTTSADQSVWICFCQSGYLTELTSSDDSVCSSVCPDATDSQQVSTWYRSNCGSDHGASEHAADTSSSTTVTAASATSAVSAGSHATTTATTTVVGEPISTVEEQASYTGSWWHAHYKWVIMLIVLFFGFIFVAVIAICLKRHHERKRDQIRGGFNAGITERSAPANSSKAHSHRHSLPPTSISSRNSPARTRDAFMPYGYGYARSESRLSAGGPGATLDAHQQGRHGSPLARGEMSAGEMEKEVGTGGDWKRPDRSSAREARPSDYSREKAYR